MNPPKSVTTPPPKLINTLFLSAPKSERTDQISTQLVMFFNSSPASISMISIGISVAICGKNFAEQYSFVCSSTNKKIEEYLFSVMIWLIAAYPFSLK